MSTESGKPPRHRHPGTGTDTRTFGQRAADWVSKVCGSWSFIIGYIVLTFLWCGANVIGSFAWDRYPFIFYTFSVSVLAILMSSIILLAGNRQADIDRTHAENSYVQVTEIEVIAKSIHQLTSEVHAITITQTHLMNDIHAIADKLDVDEVTANEPEALRS